MSDHHCLFLLAFSQTSVALDNNPVDGEKAGFYQRSLMAYLSERLQKAAKC